MVLEYDALTERGMGHDAIRAHMTPRTARFGPKLISELDACIVNAGAREQSMEIPLGKVETGMILLQELRTAAGRLIVPKGFEVTRTFLDRMNTIAPELFHTPVLVSTVARKP